MFGLLNRFLRQREDGVAAMELGLATPVFLLMFLTVTELGHMIYYSITVEKGMRSGVTYAARNKLDIITDQTRLDAIELATLNLTMTGTLDGTGEYLVDGYEQALADGYDPVVMAYTKTYEYDPGGAATPATVTIVTLSIEVPYVPLVPFVTEKFMNNPDMWIKMTHEQAIIGD